jgi:FMN-dependent dehydrogenase
MASYVRRGTGVFQTLALGATAVGIGRPQAWRLAAFSQKGVEAILAIYDRELRVIMRQAGSLTLSQSNLEVSSATWREVRGEVEAPTAAARIEVCARNPRCATGIGIPTSGQRQATEPWSWNTGSPGRPIHRKS